MKKILFAVGLVVILSFLLSALFYSSMPETIVTHWDINGSPNGSMSKNIGLFLLPIISLFLIILFFIIPSIDPLKKNIKLFRNYYDSFIFVIVLFLFFVHLFSILWNIGYRFNFSAMILVFISLLFIYIGFILNKLKRNWFIGIRTPWTISNDIVWKKTHEVGSILFKLTGLIILFGLLFPRYTIWFILVPIISTTVFLVVYSYYIYQKIKK